MQEHNIGDLLHTGFCLGVIKQKNLNGDYHVEWFDHHDLSVTTIFRATDIKHFKNILKAHIKGSMNVRPSNR